MAKKVLRATEWVIAGYDMVKGTKGSPPYVIRAVLVKLGPSGPGVDNWNFFVGFQGSCKEGRSTWYQYSRFPMFKDALKAYREMVKIETITVPVGGKKRPYVMMGREGYKKVDL